MKEAVKYKSGFWDVISSILNGAKLTLHHFLNFRTRRTQEYVSDENYFKQPDGLVTLKYPYEALPVPDKGRYRLHNEIDDCIVCDLCAKICPVNCITIDSIKATEDIGVTSDGTKKRLYAATFDIDMAKCCYCGLCTTVCPTDCLTMTPVYDFSEVDIKNMIYHFTDLTPEQAKEKQLLYEKQQEEIAAAKAAALAARNK
ncbi:NADH-quinone oxidoreductase subunit I [Pontibacter sp. SGAir0037]|uniref:NuoI/complex I 23 kDa subunit family protein n=1 Tax=Pontibacter sp. SGAir0037 TaxID=2571030 RepID=UPI0010CCF643|nr:4Fe-4S ferredoxin [Pontibacter sp. SGAir0037]